MKWRIIIYCVLLNNVLAEEEEKTRTVILDEGGVVGTKYWDGDFYEFFGVPYAEIPTGRDRYQAPLPPKPWKSMLASTAKNIVCHQSYYTEEDKDFIVSGEDDCLIVNLYVPEIASKDNLVPVVVYIHSGAYSGGNGHMAKFNYLARHDIIVISFNYRIGAIGFACLGNKEIPGNAGLKDQLAALRWIKKNVEKFGGDPNRITLAGFSVGASMAELLSLSSAAEGLIDQLILDSSSVLAPYAINRDPINTAKNLAYSMGYNGTANLDELTEFYLNASIEILAIKSINFFLPNSTFGFAPCIENVHKGIEPLLTKSPMDILKQGKYNKIPVLIGFADMEGLSRTIKFGEWREKMTQDFSNFLPADLVFDSEETKETVITEIKERYFKGKEVNHEKLQNYIDYFSDVMFKYSIMKSLKLRAAATNRKMYLYEFSYTGKLNVQHNYMDRIKGASHRDQTAYILDFFGWTNSPKDLDMRNRMTIMWADFVKYGDPTAYESAVVNYKWLPYTNENQYYLQINKKPTTKKNLFVDGYNFWNKIYEEYYWNPTAPRRPKVTNIKKKLPEADQTEQVNNSNDEKVAEGTHTKVQEDRVKDAKAVSEKKEGNPETNEKSNVVDVNNKKNNLKAKNVIDKEAVKTDRKNNDKNQQKLEDKQKPSNTEDKKPVNENKKTATEDKKPTTEGKKPATEDKKPTTEGKKPATDGKKPATEDQKPTTEGKEPATDGKKPATEDKKPGIENKKPATKDNKPATEGKKRATENKKPAVEEKKPATEGKKPATEGKKSATKDKKPVIEQNEQTNKDNQDTLKIVKEVKKDIKINQEKQEPKDGKNKSV